MMLQKIKGLRQEMSPKIGGRVRGANHISQILNFKWKIETRRSEIETRKQKLEEARKWKVEYGKVTGRVNPQSVQGTITMHQSPITNPEWLNVW